MDIKKLKSRMVDNTIQDIIIHDEEDEVIFTLEDGTEIKIECSSCAMLTFSFREPGEWSRI